MDTLILWVLLLLYRVLSNSKYVQCCLNVCCNVHRSATLRPTFDMTLPTISTRSTSRASLARRTSQTSTTSPPSSIKTSSSSPAAAGSQTQKDISTTLPYKTASLMESSASGVMYNIPTIRTLTMCLLTIICGSLLT